jgi:ubiquinone/menaquinone biosynthesis C-methylase UbiE
MRIPAQAQFHELARYYDLLNASKDYERESNQLDSLAQKFSVRPPRRWLDVACGTGRHLASLTRRYEVTGLDLSREMLRVARRRLPGVPLHRGDMRTFRLGHSFDVVSCLYSAIGHLDSPREVQAAFANFYRHLDPGGVALVEPWIEPDLFRPGYVHLATYQGPEGLIARMAFSEKRANRSLVHYHFLIGHQGKGVRFFDERETGLLLSREELVGLMSRVGFKARFLTKGLSAQRGLVVGVKPGPVP